MKDKRKNGQNKKKTSLYLLRVLFIFRLKEREYYGTEMKQDV